jgi:two-component system sensor histidine kinase AlgZ
MKQSTTPPADAQPLRPFLPNFCAIRVVFGVVISGELLAVMFTLFAVSGLHEFLPKLSLVSLLIQWIVLTTTGLLCLLRPWLNQQRQQSVAWLAWLLLQLITVLVCIIYNWLSGELTSLPVWQANQGLLLRALGISMLIGLLVLHYLHLQYLWRQQIEAENKARLQALQSRIRPHFLFNSMNTIASLTRTNAELAEEVVEDLAELFRVSLGDVKRQSNLGRELQLARQYLNIEHHRLGARLRVAWDLQGLPEQAVLPPLLLQPLLENAVYHGIEPSQTGGTIQIIGRYRQGRVNLSIRNSMPADQQHTSRRGNRLALENIRQRLASLYDGQASLTESRVDEAHQMRLVIPHPWRLE